ncbi:hypothetical protein [Lentibacillus sediminis]|nr:hypothetical protein [Lentibacillus sediminis]
MKKLLSSTVLAFILVFGIISTVSAEESDYPDSPQPPVIEVDSR